MRNLPTGTITLLFSDIEGSTQLLQQLGDDYADVLAKCRQLLRAAFHVYLGHEVDTQGDAFFVVFNRAGDAVSAAAMAQRTLSSHPWPRGVTVRVRMGLHTGEPQLSDEGYVGLDVHLAARIMNAGHGGQVLLSQTTRELVDNELPDETGIRDLGTHRLKDIARPSRLFQLVIPGLPIDFPPLKTLDAHLHNLPAQPTSFIGREQEVEAVYGLLRAEDIRLLTLTGPAGVGKTRLALQVATKLNGLFPDGIFFVALAPVRDVAGVITAITQTLDISEVGDSGLGTYPSEQRRSASRPADSGQMIREGQPLESLKAYLWGKQLLLILDNFEQVMDAALVVADLLAVCRGLKVLVTSREVLRVQAEQEFRVPPLALPDLAHLPEVNSLSHYSAIALFISRARAARPDFSLTRENAAAIARICARLDGLPLAIELAAARSRYFPPQTLLARLERGLTVLTSGARDLPERQQTLRGAIAWSYELLETEEQKLFRRLAVFVDGWTVEAAEQVCTSAGELENDILEMLGTLVDKSLLRQEEQAKGQLRYSMLQMLRAYGLESLAIAEEMEATRAAHAAYYLRLMEEAAPNLSGAEQAEWYDRLEQEHENLRAALGWMLERAGTEQEEDRQSGQAEQVLRLCAALTDFWTIRGYVSEGRDFLERALAVSEGAPPVLRGEALREAGMFAFVQDDHERADTLLQESLALFREAGDKAGEARSLRMLGSLAKERNDYSRAQSLLDEALKVYRELEDKKGIAYTREILAHVAASQGSYSTVRELLEANLLLYSALGEQHHTNHTLYFLARVLFLSQRDLAKAYSLVEESLAGFREVGHKQNIAYALGLLGQMLLQQGEFARAHKLAEESVALLREIGDRSGAVESLIGLARVTAEQGDMQAARKHYEESWTLLREIEVSELSAACLEGLGEVLASQGEVRSAARLWGKAAALRATIGAPMPPVYRVSYGRAVAAARKKVGEASFAAAWAEGRAMPLEQALAA